MTERLAMAVSLEQQIEAQNLAMALINFNQGFGAYRYKMLVVTWVYLRCLTVKNKCSKIQPDFEMD